MADLEAKLLSRSKASTKCSCTRTVHPDIVGTMPFVITVELMAGSIWVVAESSYC